MSNDQEIELNYHNKLSFEDLLEGSASDAIAFLHQEGITDECDVESMLDAVEEIPNNTSNGKPGQKAGATITVPSGKGDRVMYKATLV